MDKILSPITKTENIEHIRSLNVGWIIDEWKRAYNYDLNYLFKQIRTIELFRCKDTNYLFYYPPVMGDSAFYEQRHKKRWHHLMWKWEHEQATVHLKNDMQVLEVGCAEGGFIDRAQASYNVHCVGLELNRAAIIKGKEKKLDIRNEFLEEHSLKNQHQYDLVCCFQVLEHIADVDLFVRSCLLCLKPKGKLIISVPNNGSFISETDQILNMPPHHVGLWDEQSLKSIGTIYDLNIETSLLEPIQEYHLGFFKRTVYRNVIGKKFDNRFIRKLYREIILKPFVDKYLEYVQKWIPGHTIFVVYKKKESM